ncbi:hypothetical protein [Arthrobacter sp. ISL-95]|uniref:hypothetical protein n=1 Tax=Arthrobacter sp. ISL-95 TaxID=2819116 RepID=UPI001BED0800|nr:hypothetical protein [Arthrobacter sp. ISL-95]
MELECHWEDLAFVTHGILKTIYLNQGLSILVAHRGAHAGYSLLRVLLLYGLEGRFRTRQAV